MATYKDNNYKIGKHTVNFSSMNRKRQVIDRIEDDTDDITDFTEAMAVINYIKRTM